MRNLLLLSLLLLAGGCKYVVPLAGNTGLALDPDVMGYWVQAAPGKDVQHQYALVLRYSDDEYLVYFEAGNKGLYFRGYPVNFDGKIFVQLQLIGTSNGPVAEENRKYDILRYDVNGNSLTVSLLNADVIDRNLDSMAALRQAFRNQAGDADLFRKMGDFVKIRKTNKPHPGNG